MDEIADEWPEWRVAHEFCNDDDLGDHPDECVADAPWWSGDTELYDFVNVMWVSWREDGIAERQAVGRVHLSYWESVERENREVRLG